MNMRAQTSPSRAQVVGVGDLAVGQGILQTHALGSCVAICSWDPVVQIGFLLHFMLPDSKLDPSRAGSRPNLFCDTGFENALNAFHLAGGNRSRLFTKLAGGASVAQMGPFNVGKRNVLAARKILSRYSLLIKAEEVLGSLSRTVSFDTRNGQMILHSPGVQDRVL